MYAELQSHERQYLWRGPASARFARPLPVPASRRRWAGLFGNAPLAGCRPFVARRVDRVRPLARRHGRRALRAGSAHPRGRCPTMLSWPRGHRAALWSGSSRAARVDRWDFRTPGGRRARCPCPSLGAVRRRRVRVHRGPRDGLAARARATLSIARSGQSTSTFPSRPAPARRTARRRGARRLPCRRRGACSTAIPAPSGCPAPARATRCVRLSSTWLTCAARCWGRWCAASAPARPAPARRSASTQASSPAPARAPTAGGSGR